MTPQLDRRSFLRQTGMAAAAFAGALAEAQGKIEAAELLEQAADKLALRPTKDIT